LPTLADPGYEGVGIGTLIPVRQPAGGRELDINTRTRTAFRTRLHHLKFAEITSTTCATLGTSWRPEAGPGCGT
jgi:hypothetical protein